MFVIGAKDSYAVELAVKGGLNALKMHTKGIGPFIFGGPIGMMLGFFAVKFISSLLFFKILPAFDVAFDKLARYTTPEEFKKFAKDAAIKVTKKVHNEDEKKAIRAEYKAALKSVAYFGRGLRGN